MLLERISDGAFIMANKLDFCYTNWEFPYGKVKSRKVKKKLKIEI